jgi:hypothetical protein
MSKLIRTAVVIAQEVGAPLSRVQSILDSCTHIKPIAWADSTAIYATDATSQVRYEINCQDAHRRDRRLGCDPSPSTERNPQGKPANSAIKGEELEND